MVSAFLSILHRFSKDRHASTSVEAVLILPVLIWGYLATFVYFDAFRTQNINLKAGYTIADMISRQTNTVNSAYVNGLNTVYDYLTDTADPTSIRVTSVFYDPATSKYKVHWSYATKNQPTLSNSTINALAAELPNLTAFDYLIVVETNLDYTPLFNVAGISPRRFTQLIATRPRFANKVCYSNVIPAPACV